MNRKGVDDDRKALAPEMRTRLFDNGLQVRHLSYRYHNDEDYVLSDISFDLKPGQVMGITGPVGAGKSTLINCINGYLKPESGQLWFGSLDAARLRGDDIRQVVRTVGQEVFLFSDTIENNIAFGEGLVPDDERVGDVLYRSAMADEIERFPKGRRTMVGEKGIMLSGGQKQRISLARALYSPGKLLILDDVFSAVDTETERFLIRELFKFRQGGLIIISNRMSVLERTDFNIVLEGGRLTAMGTHQQLLETSDFYRNTHDIQEGGKR
jgi:ATP-binding cassette subfamily B protein